LTEKTKFSQLKAVQDKKQAGQDVTKLVSAQGGQKVEEYKYNSFDKKKATYDEVKKKYGSFATTDTDRLKKKRRNIKFELNSFVKQSLSVEEEEKKNVEKKVKERLLELADDVRTAARGEGYQAGLKKGYDEAFSKFKEESAEKLIKFENFVSACERAKKNIYNQNEKFLIELVYQIAKMVILKETKTDKSYLTRLVTEIIDKVGVKDNINVKINKDDMETLELLKTDLAKAHGNLQNLNIEVSDQVKQGGCVVETQWNSIDASIETQLEKIRDSIQM